LVETGEELAQLAKGLLDTVVGRFTEQGQIRLLARRKDDLNQIIISRANAIKQRLAAAGLEMLDQMAKKPDAVTLDTGVVVHVLETSESEKRPTRSSTVKIHYHGTLADGTIFDSTLSQEPVQFPLAAVIPGWRDGVLKLHQGETAMIGIPPEQAYGEEGTPDGRVPGGSTLFFKIQLLEIMSASIGGGPELLGADGKKFAKTTSGRGSGLVGADGRPL
jgi:peptidylprolyl isomerase